MKPRAGLHSVLVLAGVLSLSGTASGAAGAVRGVHAIPVKSTVFGRSYASWNMEWARFEWSPSIDQSPLLHPQGCRHKQVGRMFLLPGPFRGQTISCTVPRGSAVFVPTASGFALRTNPKKGTLSKQTMASLRREVGSQFADTKVADVTLDGARINVRRFPSTTPLFMIVMADNNVVRARPGRHVAIQAGYNFILAPFAPGRHRIKMHVKIVSRGKVVYEARTTYNLKSGG